ncbi:hypothetical protein StoSoilB3_43090 (plasmid) [Arthrobacter sp. StoSoilB3]|nr:hypothetical protein StoSoilB3_43090 [Arthrobacter sp. StoSoilB3]
MQELCDGAPWTQQPATERSGVDALFPVRPGEPLPRTPTHTGEDRGRCHAPQTGPERRLCLGGPPPAITH